MSASTLHVELIPDKVGAANSTPSNKVAAILRWWHHLQPDKPKLLSFTLFKSNQAEIS